jgi:hypothetical protein
MEVIVAAKFTFFAEGGSIEVRIVDFETPKPQQIDAIWLDSTVTVEAGAFLGSFKASFTTDDLVSLHEQLKSALIAQNGTVCCKNTGGGLSIVLTLRNDGRVAIIGIAQPNRLRGGILHFEIATDHFALVRTVRQLEDTLRAFQPSRPIKNNDWAAD